MAGVRDHAYPQIVSAPLLDLAAFGWDASWSAAASAYADLGRPGRISRVDRGLCSVLTLDGPVRATFGGAVLEAMVADTLSAPCTGDWCIVRAWPDGPLTIDALLPRRTAITRAEAAGTSRGQVLATNVDLAAVVIALHPEPNLGRIERLLSLVWESGARPVIVLTKADVVGDADEVAADVRRLATDVAVVCTSTATGAGVGTLRRLVGTRATLALIGASGHGKSSLSNALVGAQALRTVQIRKDGKGRHTSVRRELVLLPGGGAVIDTPGLRGVGLQDAAVGIRSTFPDIVALAEGCRFTNCRHLEEPGCAVQAALAAGSLAVRRLDSWHALHREQQTMAERAEARLHGQLPKGARHLSKQQRAARRSRW